jgi:PAS domain S-box-containing protein
MQISQDEWLNSQADTGYPDLANYVWDAVITCDSQGLILLWNPAAEKIFGYTHAEARTRNLVELIFPPNSGEMYPLGRTSDDNTQTCLETIAVHRDGTTFPIEFSRFQSSEDAGFTVIVRDATESRRKENTALEKRFFPLFEQAAVGFGKIGLHCEWLRVNQKLCEITGYSEKELLCMTFKDITHPDDLEADLENMEHVISGDLDINLLEKRYIRPNGEVVWVYLTASLVRKHNGEPDYFIVIVEDITQRKQVEARLNHVIQGSNDGIWDLDLSTQVSYFNDRFYEILGLARDKLIPGSNVWDLIHPEDVDRVKDNYYGHLKDPNIPYDLQFRMRNSSGEYRYLHSRAKATRDHTGQPLRMAGVVTDITERVLAEQKLQETVEREILLRHIVQEVSQSFDVDQIVQAAVRKIGDFFQVDRCMIYSFEYDPELQRFLYRLAAQHCRSEDIIPINLEEANAYSKTGLTRDLKGSEAPYVVVTTEPEEYLEVLKQYVQKIEIPLDDPTAVLWDHIERYRIKSVLGLEIFYKGLLYGSISLHHCSDRQWTEAEITLIQSLATQLGTGLYQAEIFNNEQRAKEEAQHANQLKDQFLSNMSHELRTPLNAVIGYAEMLQEGFAGRLNEKQGKYTHNIVSSGKHLLEMVNDLLDIARIEADKLKVEPLLLDLPRLLTEVEETLHDFAAKHKVTMTFRVENGIQEIHADPGRLKQILYNLVSNAIKFNHPEGQVTVAFSISENKHWILCQVIDTGIGLSEEEMSKLFTRFYQVDSSFARKVEGTGLGLALTKRLVELHGGHIGVTSKQGSGSTFTFQFPKIIPV